MAERVVSVLGEVPVWQPVLLPELSLSRDPSVSARAVAQGLPEVRWPVDWPGDGSLAMRAAVFAQQSGRVVAFSLAAFRQEFAAGRSLAVVDNVLIAAAACELHPRTVLAGVETRSVRSRLAEASAAAVSLGVRELPAIGKEGVVWNGASCPELAVRARGGCL